MVDKFRVDDLPAAVADEYDALVAFLAPEKASRLDLQNFADRRLAFRVKAAVAPKVVCLVAPSLTML